MESLAQATMKKISWMIENRGGMACLLGLVIVPAQFVCPSYLEANKIVDEAVSGSESVFERFSVPIDGKTSINGVIYYPKNWNPNDQNTCVLYHSPNAATVSDYLECGFRGTPAKIAELVRCPIILYDYRGTGISSDPSGSFYFGFRSTYASVVVDGEAMLKYALASFGSVKVVGS